MAARVFVTGGTGFLGRRIVQVLVQAGFEVTVCSRRPTPGAVVADVRDAKTILPLLAGFDCVVHAAGLAHVGRATAVERAALWQTNVVGTASVIDAAVANRVPHIVLISSVAVYGATASPANESNICRAADPYGASKLAAEREAFGRVSGTSTTLSILRMSTIVGEEDPGNVAALIGAIAKQRFIWIGSGKNRKTFVYRDDAARAVLSTVQARPEGAFNITAESITTAALVDMIAANLNKPVPRLRIPAIAARILNAISRSIALPRLQRLSSQIQTWLSNNEYDGSLFRSMTGFQPEVTIGEAIRRECEWTLRTVLHN